MRNVSDCAVLSLCGSDLDFLTLNFASTLSTSSNVGGLSGGVCVEEFVPDDSDCCAELETDCVLALAPPPLPIVEPVADARDVGPRKRRSLA